MRGNLEGLRCNVARLRGNLTGLRGNPVRLRGSLAELRDKSAELRGNLGRLHTNTIRKFKNIEESVSRKLHTFSLFLTPLSRMSVSVSVFPSLSLSLFRSYMPATLSHILICLIFLISLIVFRKDREVKLQSAERRQRATEAFNNSYRTSHRLDGQNERPRETRRRGIDSSFSSAPSPIRKHHIRCNSAPRFIIPNAH